MWRVVIIIVEIGRARRIRITFEADRAQ